MHKKIITECTVMTNKLPKIFDAVEKRGWGWGYLSSVSSFFFSPRSGLVQGWLLGWGSLSTRSAVDPPAPAPACLAPSSKGVTWADELMYVKAFVNCKAQLDANDCSC